VKDNKLTRSMGEDDDLVMTRDLWIDMSIHKQCHDLWRVEEGCDRRVITGMSIEVGCHVEGCCSSIWDI
jgi:hypothetical protein